jgi:hypothetical protein
MKKIITIMFAFMFLASCGYSPIYSSKNFDFNLKNIISPKNDYLSSKIEKKLRIFSNDESLKVISLKVDTQKKIITLTKDSKGDPSRYEMIININLEIIHNQNKNIKQSFEEKFNYDINVNKFELNQYEKEIEALLINKNIDRIIVYLSKI